MLKIYIKQISIVINKREKGIRCKSRGLFIRGRKLNISPVFFYPILLCYTKNVNTEIHLFSYYGNFKQTRASTNNNY